MGLVLGAARDVVGQAGDRQVARLDAGLPELAEVSEHVREAQRVRVRVVARRCSDAVLVEREDRRAALALAVSALAWLAVDDVVAFPAEKCVEGGHAHEDLVRGLLLRVAVIFRAGVVNCVQQVVQLLHRPGRAADVGAATICHFVLATLISLLLRGASKIARRCSQAPRGSTWRGGPPIYAGVQQARAERRAQEAPQRGVADGADQGVRVNHAVCLRQCRLASTA